MITKLIRKLFGRPEAASSADIDAHAAEREPSAPAQPDPTSRSPARAASPAASARPGPKASVGPAHSPGKPGETVAARDGQTDQRGGNDRSRGRGGASGALQGGDKKPRQPAERRAAANADTSTPRARHQDAVIGAARGPDMPNAVPADIHGINPALISRNAVRVTEGLQEAGFRAFIVGGAVRDLLLGVAPKDFDVATDATPDQVQRLFRRARIIGRRFQIVHVQFGQEIIEVSTFRALVDASGPEAEAEVRAARDEDARAAAVVDIDHQLADANDVPLDISKTVPGERPGVDAEMDAEQVGSSSIDAPRHRHPSDAPDSPSGGRRRRRRDDPDRRPHAVDASGRVLRDNVWGEQHEDARRRDFTINAMYYDPATQTVLDYHAGMADIRARLLRMIGEPAARYREDPVRMLRVARFAAKLGFDIEPNTRAPIADLADLINNVPTARVFDEILKLLLSGQALACLTQLRNEGLHHDLLPWLDTALADATGEKFVTLSLANTDQRIRAGKPVSPGFLFASLLWQQTLKHWQAYQEAGEFPIPALHRAMDEVLDTQTKKMAIQRRFVADMKEIWGLQPRLEKRSGRSALKLLEHPRFRAAYDFLLLRCESGELERETGQWWTDFISGDLAAREALLSGSAREAGATAKPRRRRRGGGRRGGGGDGGGAADSGDAGGHGATHDTAHPVE